MSMAIIVHGGAGTIIPERMEVVQSGCKEAASIGWNILRNGGTALEAVEAAVRELEDNPNYNAGTGSCLTKVGHVETDAGLMEGHTMRVGAVAGVERIKNPIVLAHKVLDSPHVLLVGEGAQEFALENGMSLCKAEDLITERQIRIWLAARKKQEVEEDENAEPTFIRREVASLPARDEKGKIAYPKEEPSKHGTVGAVAIDQYGNLAAATSTGGIHNKHSGRVGDTPLVGCGFYADEQAAISCTGDGEDFVRLLIAKRAADFVARGTTAREAAEAVIALLSAKATGTGGVIIVDRLGNVGFAWNSKNLARAYMTENLDEPVTGV